MKIPRRLIPVLLGVLLISGNNYQSGAVLGKAPVTSASPNPPSAQFNLTDWKLQIPGPQDIRNIDGYVSNYFYLDKNGWMIFALNCSETGTTRNSTYVRSELRHIPNWPTASRHFLAGTIKVDSQASPDKVTVMQIHGITQTGGNAPPLLRVALNEGHLYAFIKTDNTGNKTDRVLLTKDIEKKEFRCAITVENKQLQITVNRALQLNRNISFWKWDNYFKAGAYPQAHEGFVKVMYKNLEVK